MLCVILSMYSRCAYLVLPLQKTQNGSCHCMKKGNANLDMSIGFKTDHIELTSIISLVDGGLV